MRIGGKMALAVAVLGMSSMASAAQTQILIKWGNTVPAVDAGTGRSWNSVPIAAGTQLQPTLAAPQTLKWADGTTGPTLAVSEPADIVFPPASIPPEQYIGFNNNGGSATGPAPATLTGAAASFNWVGTDTQAYGSPTLWAGGYSPGALLTVSGLTPGQAYNLTFFASRVGAGDTRTTAYTVTGLTTSPKQVLNVASNLSNVAQVLSVLPDATGHFTIDVRPDSTNNNANSFYYLNVMEIDTAAVPEPASLGLLGLGSLALLKRRRV